MIVSFLRATYMTGRNKGPTVVDHTVNRHVVLWNPGDVSVDGPCRFHTHRSISSYMQHNVCTWLKGDLALLQLTLTNANEPKDSAMCLGLMPEKTTTLTSWS